MKEKTDSKSKTKKTIVAGAVGTAAAAAAAAGVALEESVDAGTSSQSPDVQEEMPTDVADVMAEVLGTTEEMVAMATEGQEISLDGVTVTGHMPVDESGVILDDGVVMAEEIPAASVREEYGATVEAASPVHEQPMVAQAAPTREPEPVDDSVQILDDTAVVNDVAVVVEPSMAAPEPVADGDFYDPDSDVVSYMSDDADMAMGDTGGGFVDDVVAAIKDFGESVSEGISNILSHDSSDGMVDSAQDTDVSDYINDANVDAFL